MSHKRSAQAYSDPTGPRMVDHPNAKEVLSRIEDLLNTGKGKQLDEFGREVLDPRPVAPPVGYVKQPSMVEHIRGLVRSHMLAAAAEAVGAETFEDADDFDVGDEQDDPRTPYEAVFDPPAPTLPEGSPSAAGDPSKPREAAPQAQGTQPQAGEAAPATSPPGAGPSNPPQTPQTLPR